MIPINQTSNLKIEIGVKSSSANSLKGKILFSNLQTSTISNLKFLIAVPKSCKLDCVHKQATRYLDLITTVYNKTLTLKIL